MFEFFGELDPSDDGDIDSEEQLDMDENVNEDVWDNKMDFLYKVL